MVRWRWLEPRLNKRSSKDQVFHHAIRRPDRMKDAVKGRIVQVCGSLSHGGAERQVAISLRELSRANLESVHLICTFLDPPNPPDARFFLPLLADAGVHVSQLPSPEDVRSPLDQNMPRCFHQAAPFMGPNLAREIASYYRAFRTLRPEVVHSWLDYCNVRAGMAAVLAGVPRIVISGRNLNPSHFALYQDFMDPAYKALIECRQLRMINNSAAGAEDYAAWLGIPPAEISIIYNGVDPVEGDGADGPPDTGSAAAFRAEFGIDDGAPLIGSVFRFYPEKQPQLWIETAAILAEAMPSARFVVLGEGPYRQQMEAIAQERGFADRLIMPGVRRDVLSALGAFDVFLLTAALEGTPNVVLEAQSVGTPVVATDAGGMVEAVDHGRSGFIVGSADAATLAKQVAYVLNNQQFVTSARVYGPAFVARRFGVRRMVRETLDVYGYDANRSATIDDQYGDHLRQ